MKRIITAILAAFLVAGAQTDLYLPFPEENPITPAKIELGRRLFHDRRTAEEVLVGAAARQIRSRPRCPKMSLVNATVLGYIHEYTGCRGAAAEDREPERRPPQEP